MSAVYLDPVTWQGGVYADPTTWGEAGVPGPSSGDGAIVLRQVTPAGAGTLVIRDKGSAAELGLPSIALSGSGSVRERNHGDILLHQIFVAGLGRVSIGGQAAIVLPRLTALGGNALPARSAGEANTLWGASRKREIRP